MLTSMKAYFYFLVTRVLLLGSAPLYAQVDIALTKTTTVSAAIQAPPMQWMVTPERVGN